MSARLLLLAHARTVGTGPSFPAHEPIAAGQPGPATDRAWPKARRILSSPARAARDTAGNLFGDHRIEPGLRDLDYGRWAGRPLSAVLESEAEAAVLWRSDPSAAPHGGEAITTLMKRVATWLEAESLESETTIAVTHADFMRAALIQALGAPASAFWNIDVEPLALVALTHDGRRWAFRVAARDRS